MRNIGPIHILLKLAHVPVVTVHTHGYIAAVVLARVVTFRNGISVFLALHNFVFCVWDKVTSPMFLSEDTGIFWLFPVASLCL